MHAAPTVRASRLCKRDAYWTKNSDNFQLKNIFSKNENSTSNQKFKNINIEKSNVKTLPPQEKDTTGIILKICERFYAIKSS